MGFGCRTNVGFVLPCVVILVAHTRPAHSAESDAALPAFRTLLARPIDNLRLRQVLERASRRLRSARCRRLLTEFSDQAGEPLQARLDALGLSGERYLAYVVFENAAKRGACTRREVLAFTSPGSRVVGVCAPAFFGALRHDPAYLEAVIIHETLHTLGLGENPPSSVEIMDRVLRLCF
jgi:hypothetical protein